MEQQVLTGGGLQYVPQIAAIQQTVYLDFDGEQTSYNGEILTVDNVEVKNSSLTDERIAHIVTELNAMMNLFRKGQLILMLTKQNMSFFHT